MADTVPTEVPLAAAALAKPNADTNQVDVTGKRLVDIIPEVVRTS